MDFLLIAIIMIFATLIYLILKLTGIWGQIAAVLDKAWVAFLLAGGLFYIAFNMQICPMLPTCAPYDCAWNDPGCWINFQFTTWACNTQQGAAITLCHLIQAMVGGIAFMLLLFGVAKVIVNVFEH